MKRRAFTLIELLVVIAIIAILAAILFPVFAQAKVAAKAAVVLSNQKQMGIGCAMYMSDNDDTMPSYITRLDLPANGFHRDDIVSWVQQFDPYVKNGKPIYPTSNPADPGYVPPTGIYLNSTWTETAWAKAANLPDCDGDGALTVASGWLPVKLVHAHFGMTFPANVRAGANYLSDPSGSDGTQARPDFYFAGSYLPGRASTNTTNRNSTMTIDQISRPAETTFITDGFTGVLGSGNFGVTTGCESSNMYKGGGNVAFCDSHVKFVKGNSERYLAQDSAGRWYKKYYTIDR